MPEPQMIMSIRLPVHIHTELQAAKASNGTSMNALIVKMIERGLTETRGSA